MTVYRVQSHKLPEQFPGGIPGKKKKGHLAPTFPALLPQEPGAASRAWGVLLLLLLLLLLFSQLQSSAETPKR